MVNFPVIVGSRFSMNAQLLAWGARGSEFESRRPDQLFAIVLLQTGQSFSGLFVFKQTVADGALSSSPTHFLLILPTPNARDVHAYKKSALLLN